MWLAGATHIKEQEAGARYERGKHYESNGDAALPEFVEDNFGQPFMRYPGAALAGERKRIGVGNVTRLDDPLPGAEVPPEVGIGGIAGGHGQKAKEQDGGKEGSPFENFHGAPPTIIESGVSKDDMTRTAVNRRKERVACVFLLGLTLLNAASVVRVAPLLWKGYQDFTNFYGAAEMVRGGQAARLYDLALQSKVQEQIAPNVAIRQGGLPYMHPPFEALLFLPLTYLSYLPAYMVWTFLNIIMLALSLGIAWEAFPEVRSLSVTFIVLCAGGFVPLTNGIIQGQDSVLLLLLATLSLAYFETRRDVAGGVALGAGLFRFHLALPMAVIMAVRRPRLLLGLVPMAAALVAISTAISGWRGLAGYFELLFRLEQTGAGGAIPSVGMPSLRGLIAELPGANAGSSLVVGLTLAASLVVAGAVVWVITKRNVPLRLVFALAIMTAILLSYHTFTHDLTLLLIVILLLVSEPPAIGGWGDTVLLIVVYTLFLGWSWWPRLIPFWFVPMVGWVFWRLRRGGRQDAVA